jgi:protein-S-isoprenylcysteine O-methyltransferase Ste14
MSPLYVAVLASTVLAVLGMAYSILRPENRLWPPPGRGSWEFRVVVVVDTVCTIGVPVLGLLDRGSLGIGYPLAFPLGALLILVSSLLIAWAMRALGLGQSFGLEGGLVADGPYRYSRNPQYVGFVLMLIGVVLVTNSVQALVTGSMVIVLVLLAPYAEEPWLRERFGRAYDEYCDRVPRFLGLRSFRG